MSEKVSSRARAGARYDDWVCLLCLNHNYSFRTLCTSCATQATDAGRILASRMFTSKCASSTSHSPLPTTRHSSMRTAADSSRRCCCWRSAMSPGRNSLTDATSRPMRPPRPGSTPSSLSDL